MHDHDKVQETPLSYKDFTILMEAYKNNVEFTTTLLEQQKQLFIQQEELLEMNEKIKKNTFDTNIILENKFKDMAFKIHCAWIASSTIIISLIGLIYTITSKFQILEQIAIKILG